MTVVDLLSELIRNRCVNDGRVDSGHEHRSVTTLIDFIGHAGEIVEPAPGRSSVVFRVPGTHRDAPALLLMGHTDVVPVNETGWSRDPFGGEIVDGTVWGRGAVDMLNLTASMATVFKRHADGDLPPLPGDLIFLGVADEEAGGVWGAQHLVDERWDLVGAPYVLTEIAAPALPTPGGPVIPVTTAEKGPSWRRLRTNGTPGHASQPYGTDNALVPLATALAELSAAGTPVRISPEWEAFVMALSMDAEMERRLLDPDAVDGAIDDIALSDPGFARWAHACTHLTITPTILEAGIKANVVPDSAFGEIDVRKVPGQDEPTVDDHLRKVIGPASFDRMEIEPLMTFPATSSLAAGLLWEAVGDGCETVLGHRRIVPSLIPVSTDARMFRAKGSIAYGVGLFDDGVSFGDLLSMFHGNDERVSVQSMEMTVEFLQATVEAFGLRSLASQ